MVYLSPLDLIMGVAAAFILLGGALFIKTLRFRTNAHLIDVRLVRGEEFGALREDGLMAVRLSYEYTASDGRVIEADRTSLRRRIPPVGITRKMLVDPKKPEILRRPGVREYLVPIEFALTGVVMLLVTVILY